MRNIEFDIQLTRKIASPKLTPFIGGYMLSYVSIGIARRKWLSGCRHMSNQDRTTPVVDFTERVYPRVA